MPPLLRVLLLGLSSLLLASTAFAETPATPRSTRPAEPLPDSPLRVLVVGNAPFVMGAAGTATEAAGTVKQAAGAATGAAGSVSGAAGAVSGAAGNVSGAAGAAAGTDGPFDGISVEIWREVAARLGVGFTLERAKTIPDALAQLDRDQADVAIGPISITAERAQVVHFMQPYFESALGILAPAAGTSFWERLRPFLTGAFLGGAAILFAVLLGIGVLLWWVEHRRNPQFAREPARGWGTGLWLAIVTMTTVGYGDKVPITPAGRAIAAVWMLISMLTVSSLTAFLATALTVASLDRSTLDSAEDLPGRRVAAVKGSTGADFARRHGARLVPVASVGEAIDRVAAGQADAVVHDRPMLQYELRERGASDLVVSPATYERQDYGFALRPGDELAHRLDVTLLELVESGRVQRIVDDWLESP